MFVLKRNGKTHAPGGCAGRDRCHMIGTGLISAHVGGVFALRRKWFHIRSLQPSNRSPTLGAQMNKMKTNRREFLVHSALATASGIAFPHVVPAAVLGRDGLTAPSERITLGAIGVGSMGQADVKGLMQVDGVQVVAVCDVFEQRRADAKKIVDAHHGNADCKTYGDFRDVLARSDIDAVSITTQDHWHALIATAAAKAGKDIYCQKPLGMTVQQCQAIRDAVRRHGRVFQTGTQQRSDSEFRLACQLVRNGYLGKLHTIEVAAPGPMYKRTYQQPTTPEPIPAGFDFDRYLGPAPERALQRRPLGLARLVSDPRLLCRLHCELGCSSSRHCQLGMSDRHCGTLRMCLYGELSP